MAGLPVRATPAGFRDMALALRARRHGARYSLRIVREARRTGVPISLAFALIEQESNFSNVYGHDGVPSVPSVPPAAKGVDQNRWPVRGGPVTATNYRAYKARRGPTGIGGMQGVGPAQLTWYEFQDAADRLGGCHVPAYNIAIGMEHLADLIRQRGLRAGIKGFNGSGPAAEEYVKSVLTKRDRWHRFLA